MKKQATEETVNEEVQNDLDNGGKANDGGGDGGGENPAEDNRDSEIARLRAENESLKSRPSVQTQSQSQTIVTSNQLRGLSDSEWAPIEEKTGKTRDQILSSVESNEAKQSAHQSESRWRVAEALDEAAEKDPQVHKLKSAMREYLSDVSIEDKLDPAKLSRHLERAKTFAKGRLAEKGGFRTQTETSAGKTNVRDNGPKGEGDDVDDDADDGAVKAGAEVQIGKWTLKVKDLPEKLKAREKEIRHRDDPNGVSFKNFDKKPVFKR